MSTAKDKPVTQGELTAGLQDVRKEMQSIKEEILQHFDVVAENIHRDVAGANHDEISLLHNKVDNHEERIVALER